MRITIFFLKTCVALIVAGVLSVGYLVAAEVEEPAGLAAADEIVASIADGKLRLLLEEVLERNPRLARLQAEASAVAQRVPQVKALPDPTASLTWFLLPPQTRVGPQRAAVNLSQRLPWFGTLKLDEQAAVWEAAASRALHEAARISVLKEARVGYLELRFLESERRLVGEDRATLEHYAELALARYASGVGLDQAVIKIQAEITRTDARLLAIASRRAAVVARLNALRDRPQTTPLVVEEPRPLRGLVLDAEELRTRALDGRPELAAAQARVEAAELRVERRKKSYNPNVVVGLNYGYVGRRDDEAGRLNPPQDNGQDILGLSGGLSVPLWRSKLEAGVEEGVLTRLAAEEGRRELTAAIDGDLGDLLHRIPLLVEQVELYDHVLMVQARQSLLSAESAYASGTADALDLLDAERVLHGVRIAAERVRTDLGVAYAKLEGVIAGPLAPLKDEEIDQ
jgi:cobalt-zinc-cadmium efflux system outer membrane protein